MSVKKAVTDIDTVAELFLSITEMDHKKLQKLCYYAYSWYLALYGKDLFENRFEAWVHGPVDPVMYQKYRVYGWNEIPKKRKPPASDSVKSFVKMVYNSYGHLTGNELEYLTHQEDPWRNARAGIGEFEPSQEPIKSKDIKKYYKRLAENEQNE